MNINVYCQFKYTPVNNVGVPSEEGSWNFTMCWEQGVVMCPIQDHIVYGGFKTHFY